MTTYKVIQGIDYGEKRVEPGDLVSDLPKDAVGWLLDNGSIEELEETPTLPKVILPPKDTK